MNPETSFVSAIKNAKTNTYRDMPWRQEHSMSAYEILVSEMMLQQTQVSRVIPKFLEFIKLFPNVHALADAKLSEVLLLWNGLGYNRRAKYLHEAAKVLAVEPEPWMIELLESCKGIGPNTAKAVRVYAYNIADVFVETNVRTVFVHYFFQDTIGQVHDKDILALATEHIDENNPREWYWAVMDEGARLKTQKQSHNHRASSFKKQAAFKGSRRQLRGAIIRHLTSGPIRASELAHTFQEDARYTSVLADLLSEELVVERAGKIGLHDT